MSEVAKGEALTHKLKEEKKKTIPLDLPVCSPGVRFSLFRVNPV